MRNFLWIAVLFALLLYHPQQGRPVKGMDVFDSSVFQCGQKKNAQWVNNLGNIKIYQSQVWMGMYAGDVADLWAQVNTGGNLLHRGNWDHYADPTGITDQIQLMNWTPNYILLRNGETLDFTYGCYKVGTAQIVVTIWYAQ